MACAQPSVRLPYGVKSGKLVHATETARGLACGCTCPGCGARLVAHQDSKVSGHFKHHQAHECTIGLESTLHLLAKELLKEHCSINRHKLYTPVEIQLKAFSWKQWLI